MLITGSVAAFTRDCSDGCAWSEAPAIVVGEFRRAGVTEQARAADRAVGVEKMKLPVPWRNVPSMAGVPGDRRFFEIISHLDRKRSTSHAAADLIRNHIFGGNAGLRNPMNHPRVFGVTTQNSTGKSVFHTARRKKFGRPDGAAHRRSVEACRF